MAQRKQARRITGAAVDNIAGKAGREEADRRIARDGLRVVAELTERQWEDIARTFWPAARDEHSIPTGMELDYVGTFGSQARRHLKELTAIAAPGAVKP